MSDETTQAEKVYYIGPNKVTGVLIIDQKTPMGNDILKIQYENGSTEIMPKKTYDILVLDIATKLEDLLTRKFHFMTPAVIAVMSEYDLRVNEIDRFFRDVAGSLDNSFYRAVNYVLTKEDREYVPGENPVSRRSLLEADAIIKSIPDEKPTNVGADTANSQ